MKIIVFVFIALATTTPGLAQSDTDTVRWLTESSFDLRTTDPELEIEGIPFEKIFADVDMVLVGEATHGTKEFAEIKHRLFRYLAENLGFRYFFVEADFAAGLAVDRYICGGGGDPVEVLKGLRYYHIVNKEGLALIMWMKSFNETRSASEKIRFFGMDCTISDNALMQLKDYFLRVDSVFYEDIKAMRVRNHRPDVPEKYQVLTLSKDTIEMLKNRLSTNKRQYIDLSSHADYTIALRLSEVLSQSFDISQSEAVYAKREEYMAANVEWALSELGGEHAKAFVWAHNDHVMYGDITEGRNGKLVGRSFGKTISNKLNGKVYSIGLYFNEGSFIANEIKQDTIMKRVWKVDEVPENRFLYLLSKTNRDASFMDFHSFENKNLISWLRDNRVSAYSVGGAYYPTHPAYNSRSYPLLECFDGLIFIDDTHEITLDLH